MSLLCLNEAKVGIFCQIYWKFKISNKFELVICHVQKGLLKTLAFFFKQWGGTNKKKAGRLLNGQTYSEMPETA